MILLLLCHSDGDGCFLLFEKRPALKPEQHRYAAKKTFTEPDVIRQIDEAKNQMDAGNLDYFSGDEEQFAKMVDDESSRYVR